MKSFIDALRPLMNASFALRPEIKKLPFGFKQTWQVAKARDGSQDLGQMLASLHTQALTGKKLLILGLIDDPEAT